MFRVVGIDFSRAKSVISYSNINNADATGIRLGSGVKIGGDEYGLHSHVYRKTIKLKIVTSVPSKLRVGVRILYI